MCYSNHDSNDTMWGPLGSPCQFYKWKRMDPGFGWESASYALNFLACCLIIFTLIRIYLVIKHRWKIHHFVLWVYESMISTDVHFRDFPASFCWHRLRRSLKSPANSTLDFTKSTKKVQHATDGVKIINWRHQICRDFTMNFTSATFDYQRLT